MKKKNKFKKTIGVIIIILISICFFTSLTTITTAEEKPADKYTLLVSLPGLPTETPTDLGNYLSKMFIILIGVAGVLAVIMITRGGIMYMTAEAVGTKTDAKKRITDAIFGLVLALSSYLLLNTIDTKLVKGGLSLEPVPAPKKIKPSPPQTIYKGTCQTNGIPQQCTGGSLAECIEDCRTQCPTKIKWKIYCSEKHGSTEWEGVCYINKYDGALCGSGTTNKEDCETSCEADSKCIKEPISYPVPCQKK